MGDQRAQLISGQIAVTTNEAVQQASWARGLAAFGTMGVGLKSVRIMHLTENSVNEEQFQFKLIPVKTATTPTPKS